MMDKHTVSVELVKASPGISVATIANTFGWSWSGVITALTIVLLAVQIGYQVWKWRREAKASANFEKALQ